MTTHVGIRKLILSILYAVLYTIVLIFIIMYIKPIITSYEIFAIGTGYCGLIATIIYGYKQEYKFKNKEIENEKK
jgi:succinate-acetate transporter protein